MPHIYTASAPITIDGMVSSILATIENPASSGVAVVVLGLVEQPNGDGNPPPTRVRRHTGTIEALVVDVGAIPVPYPNLSTSPIAQAVVRTNASHSFTPPVSDPTFAGELDLLARFPPEAPVILLPGETGVLWSIEGGGGVSIDFAVQWLERPLMSRVVHVASSTLPASGDYSEPDFYTLPDGTKTATFTITYTRATAGGYATHRVQWTNGVEIVDECIVSNALAITQPSGVVQIVGGVFEGRRPQTADPITYMIHVIVPNKAAVRLLSAEAGMTGSPGTHAVVIETGSA